jgi:hypothetical protein
MTDTEFFSRSLELATEFDRYVLAHPELAQSIPQDAIVLFLVENDPDFNATATAIARRHRESGQPVVVVRVEGVRPKLESRLVNPRLEPALTI